MAGHPAHVAALRAARCSCCCWGVACSGPGSSSARAGRVRRRFCSARQDAAPWISARAPPAAAAAERRSVFPAGVRPGASLTRARNAIQAQAQRLSRACALVRFIARRRMARSPASSPHRLVLLARTSACAGSGAPPVERARAACSNRSAAAAAHHAGVLRALGARCTATRARHVAPQKGASPSPPTPARISAGGREQHDAKALQADARCRLPSARSQPATNEEEYGRFAAQSERAHVTVRAQLPALLAPWHEQAGAWITQSLRLCRRAHAHLCRCSGPRCSTRRCPRSTPSFSTSLRRRRTASTRSG